MAPVIAAMRRCQRELLVRVCATAQHREMLDQVNSLLGLEPDLDLGWMRPDQSLNALSSLAFASLDRVVVEQAPDWILVQGDTTTAMVAAMVGFHRRVRVGHVEAGLRTGDLARPFPEEANRRIIDLVAEALFVPTERARRALRAEGVAEERIFLTGNTVVDALLRIADEVGEVATADQVLVTAHRRESFGQPLREIFGALRELAEAFPATRWVYPVHPNPNVSAPAREILAGLANVELHPPFDYPELVRQLRASRLVLTDSGGLQEEAPTFGKPVLVVRDTTERPEGIEAGVARLVGTERARIVAETRRLLTDPAAYETMARAINPYGDGRAAERIVAILCGRQAEAWR